MLSRENMILVVIAICVLSSLYLFKEVRDLKNTPPQIMRVPYPVQTIQKIPEQTTKKIVVEEKQEDEEIDEE